MDSNTANSIACLLDLLTEKSLRDMMHEKVNDENLYGAIVYINKGDRINAFNSIYKFLPESLRYELFVDIYSDVEYGFTKFSLQILEEIVRLRPDTVTTALKKHADENDQITIYRGEAQKSTNIKKALSWTLNRNTAEWFARRFRSKGCVYKAKTNINSVLAYIQGRNEEEVLVRYQDLDIIEKAIL